MAVSLDRSALGLGAPADLPAEGASAQADRPRRRWRPTDTGWVAIAAFFVYILFALWIRFHLEFIIGDSLARTANAVYVIGGRDPHLGAVSFYWPPLHSLLQVPLIPLLQPFGRSELAGPIVSALSMAGTVAVLGALGRRLGTPRFVNLAISLLFAFSPLMIFYGANGMSEASFFFFVALAFYGYLGWTRTGRTAALGTAALALAGAELIRYEALLLIVVLAVCGGLHLRRIHRSLSAVVALALPGFFAFFYLLVLQLVLLKDPLYFLKAGKAAAPQPGALRFFVPDAQHHPLSAVTWSMSRAVVFGPAIILLGIVLLRPLLRSRPRRPVAREVLALAGAWLVYPALNAVLVLKGTSFGNSRYFVVCTLIGTVAALWLTSAEPQDQAVGRGRVGMPLRAGMAVALVALTSVVTTVAESIPSYAKVEHENVVFRAMVNNPDPKGSTPWAQWRELAQEIDPRLTGENRLLADVSYAFPLAVFSKRVDHMIVTNDTDFKQVVADPEGRFQYVLVPRAGVVEASGVRDVVTPIVAGAPDRWRSIGEFGAVTLFEYVGPAAP